MEPGARFEGGVDNNNQVNPAMIVAQRQLPPKSARYRQVAEAVCHGCAGYAAVGVCLVVGHVECHLTGLSAVFGVGMASLASVITGRNNGAKTHNVLKLFQFSRCINNQMVRRSK